MSDFGSPGEDPLVSGESLLPQAGAGNDNRPGLGDRPGFDDRKAPGAFRTIGEVALALGIRQHVLRYWEDHFPMLRPVKRSGNRRYYRPEDVQLVETIDRLVHHQGYTLRGARLALEDASRSLPRVGKSMRGAVAHSDGLAPNGAGTDLIHELLAIRATLAAVLEA